MHITKTELASHYQRSQDHLSHSEMPICDLLSGTLFLHLPPEYVIPDATPFPWPHALIYWAIERAPPFTLIDNSPDRACIPSGTSRFPLPVGTICNRMSHGLTNSLTNCWRTHLLPHTLTHGVTHPHSHSQFPGAVRAKNAIAFKNKTNNRVTSSANAYA